MRNDKLSIGVLVDSFGLPINAGLKKASAMGIQGVQIYAVSGEMAPENLSREKIAAKRSLVKSLGLEISAVCGDLGGHGFTVAQDNPSKIERSKRIVDLTLELGSRIVTTHIGVVPEDENSDRYKILQDACNELAIYAHANEAFFAIETGPETAPVLRKFLDSLDTAGVGVNLDPANFVMVTGQDPVAAVYELKDYIVHTHAKDGIMLRKTDPKMIYDYFAEGGIGDLRLDDFFKEVPLGEGSVQFREYVRALDEIGFSGYLTIERETGEDPARDILMAVDYLKDILAQRRTL